MFEKQIVLGLASLLLSPSQLHPDCDASIKMVSHVFSGNSAKYIQDYRNMLSTAAYNHTPLLFHYLNYSVVLGKCCPMI